MSKREIACANNIKAYFEFRRNGSSAVIKQIEDLSDIDKSSLNAMCILICNGNNVNIDGYSENVRRVFNNYLSLV